MTRLKRGIEVAEMSAIPIALYAVIAVLVVPVFPHFMSPNETSRWVTAAAVIDFHTIEVTPVIHAVGVRMDDLASYQGRLYSNKAPGGALAGLPAYVIARAIVGPPNPENIRTTLNAMRLLASTLPSLFLALWLHIVARRLGCPARRARVAVVTLLFATPLFAYGLLFFAHALSAFTIFGAWALLFSPSRSARNDVLAGALIGLAVLSEYPMAIPAAAMLLCALPILRIRGGLLVAAGGLPFALFLGLYNRAAFGSFFSLSTAHEQSESFRELASSGVFGVGIPSIEYLTGLLADPSKGLFVLSPALLLAAGGLRPAWRSMPRPAFLALLAVPLAILLTIAGYPNWHGGWTTGARYLVSALPFLALLLAFARDSLLEPILLGASVVSVSLVSLVFPFVPPEYPAPWITFAWPILREGLIAPNLLHFVWRPLAVTVPFLLVGAAAAVSFPPRRLALVVLGGVLSIIAGVLATGSSSLQQPIIRSLVQEVHFSDTGAIQRTLPPGPQRNRLEGFARAAKQIPPPAWPF